MTSSNGNTSALLAICAGNLPVSGEFPAQKPVTRSFDVFFDLRLNKRLSKQSWGSWFEMLSRPLWRHRNDLVSSWSLLYSKARQVKDRHNNDVIIGAMASQIPNRTIVYSTVYLSADQRKYQSSASLAFVWGIHRWPVNSPHNGPVMRKMFPFDDVMMFHAILPPYQPASWNTLHYTIINKTHMQMCKTHRQLYRELVLVHSQRTCRLLIVSCLSYVPDLSQWLSPWISLFSKWHWILENEHRNPI